MVFVNKDNVNVVFSLVIIKYEDYDSVDMNGVGMVLYMILVVLMVVVLLVNVIFVKVLFGKELDNCFSWVKNKLLINGFIVILVVIILFFVV